MQDAAGTEAANELPMRNMAAASTGSYVPAVAALPELRAVFGAGGIGPSSGVAEPSSAPMELGSRAGNLNPSDEAGTGAFGGGQRQQQQQQRRHGGCSSGELRLGVGATAASAVADVDAESQAAAAATAGAQSPVREDDLQSTGSANEAANELTMRDLGTLSMSAAAAAAEHRGGGADNARQAGGDAPDSAPLLRPAPLRHAKAEATAMAAAAQDPANLKRNMLRFTKGAESGRR